MIPITVAEIGINHNGDMKIAKRLIDVAAKAGCTYVKFQKRHIDSCYTEDELNLPRESPWGTTTKEQKCGLEFSLEQYGEIDEYCKDKIGWFYSPWDLKSVADMCQFKTAYVKVPSARITDIEYLHAVNLCGPPVILSTGMSTLKQVDFALDVLGHDKVDTILHCTSTYPTKPEECNINCIQTLKNRYLMHKVGFSNHYPGLMAMLLAAAQGVSMIEFHITMDRSMYGSDQAASIETHGVFELMSRLKLIDKMMGDGEKCVYLSELPIIDKLR